MHTSREEISEKQVEALFARRVRESGGKSYKWSSPSHRGVPDRIVIAPEGRVYFVELKRPSGKLSKLQVIVQSELTALGANVYTLYDKEDVHEFIKRVFNQG